MRRQSFLLLGLTAVVAFLLGLVAAGSRTIGDARNAVASPVRASGSPLTVSVASAAPSPVSGAGVDFSVVAARMNGAVVNIDAVSRGTERTFTPGFSRRAPRAPGDRGSGDDETGPRDGSGSGFIIDSSGYILTNNHVIEGADRVTVTLGDGRVFRATVVGSDPAIDVALLRVPATTKLPVATLGDSDGLRVGEWVCAIGNPLGYVHSVTVGVVSFIGRKLFDKSLDAFIQTDAAISVGNSGGPLINSRGEVVGITTAVSTQAANVGFAIPISQVMDVLPQLKEDGRVSRGYIGVSLTDATPELRQSLHLGQSRGALVEDVAEDTPADRAGLRVYDLITAVDGKPVQSADELIRQISSASPGTVTALAVSRDGESQALRVRLAERPLPQSARRLSGTPLPAVSPVVNGDQARVGLTVKALDAATYRRLDLPDSFVGVLVSEVDPTGPARLAGIRTGHILLEINRRRVTSVAEFRAIVASLRPGDTAALFVYDRRSEQHALYAVALDPQ